jgi:hypothetical protein
VQGNDTDDNNDRLGSVGFGLSDGTGLLKSRGGEFSIISVEPERPEATKFIQTAGEILAISMNSGKWDPSLTSITGIARHEESEHHGGKSEMVSGGCLFPCGP